MNGNVLWSGWKNVREIGSGSYGKVYEIERRLFENDTEAEKAAVKVITVPRNNSDIEELYDNRYDKSTVTNMFYTQMKSIVAEYSLMRKMNGSANIVNCDDVYYEQHSDGIGWDIYIKMELLTPLTKSLPAAISDEQVIKIAKDICAALTLCGKHNIVHRDIKPQNIFVSENGDYKLGDFGIAKTIEKTMGGTKTGTYKYMAPEVYNDKPYNSTADIYSLGLVLYWMLNERRLPFFPLPPATPDHDEVERAKQRRFLGEKIPAPKHGSKELKRIVLKACAYDPKDRYQTAQEMWKDLMGLDFDTDDEGTDGPDFDTDDEGTDGPDFDTDDEGTEGPDFDTDDEGTEGPDFDTDDEGDHDGEGDTDENNWRIIVAIACVLAVILLAILLWPCSHEWVDATCTEAKVCSKCELTEGEALGHNWEKATCTEPPVCTRCGATKGNALGHKWEQVTETDYVETKIVTYSQCTLCMKKENKETHDLTTLLSDDGTTFRIPAAEYFKRLDGICSKMDLDAECSFGKINNNVSIGILENGVLSGTVFFYNDRKTQKPVKIQEPDKDKEEAFSSIQITISRNSSEMDGLLTAFVAACEPVCAENPDLAHEIVVGALAYSGEEVVYPYGSLGYLMNITSDFVVLNAYPL